MDPITRLAQEFMESWQRFRRSSKARLFRLVTDPSMHRDLCRIFRAIEMSPDNRSPYFLFDTAFANRSEFFAACAAKLAGDYALIREGLARDGVKVGELTLRAERSDEPEENFARAVEAVWERFKHQFEYLMIIFLPSKIEEQTGWPITIEKVVALLASSRVRIAVADTTDGLLKKLCADRQNFALSGTFFIANEAVQQYLFKVAGSGWKAMSGDSQAGTGNERDREETAKSECQRQQSPDASGTGQPAVPQGGRELLSADEAARLRVSMAKAATSSADHKADETITALRDARSICRRNGLATHEAIVMMAIANTFLAEQNDTAALEHYSQAIAIAAQASAPVVVMQARMGAAAVWFRGHEYDRSAQTYELAAKDAGITKSEIMRIEALRMAGTCHNLRNRTEDVVRCWSQALEAASGTTAARPGASTVERVGQAFVDLCTQHGLTEQAKSVAQQVETIKERVAALTSGQAAT
jgi:hypothetical protein